MGRVTATELPDATTTTMTYDLRGNRIAEAGSQTYAVNYTFDPQGRMITMTTTNAEGPSETQWIYNAARGWLDRKEYDDGNGTNYTYTSAGRLGKRGQPFNIDITK